MPRVWVVMNKGSCRPQASAQGLTYKCSVQWFCHGVWLQVELACDDPRKTVLMMPPSISYYCLEGAEEEMRMLANN